jgi:hypothetical protein
MLLRPLTPRPLRLASVLAAWLALLAPFAGPRPAAAAEPEISQLPGYIPMDQLGLFAHRPVEIEINLSGPMLHFVGELTRDDDPEFSKVMAELRGIQVRVARLDRSAGAAGSEPMRGQLAAAGRWLESHGWKAIVRVQEKDEDSSIYTLLENQQIAGLAVLHFHAGEEAALVNIIGRLDPAELRRLGRALDLPQLERLKDPAYKPKPGRRPQPDPNANPNANPDAKPDAKRENRPRPETSGKPPGSDEPETRVSEEQP